MEAIFITNQSKDKFSEPQRRPVKLILGVLLSYSRARSMGKKAPYGNKDEANERQSRLRGTLQVVLLTYIKKGTTQKKKDKNAKKNK